MPTSPGSAACWTISSPTTPPVLPGSAPPAASASRRSSPNAGTAAADRSDRRRLARRAQAFRARHVRRMVYYSRRRVDARLCVWLGQRGSVVTSRRGKGVVGRFANFPVFAKVVKGVRNQLTGEQNLGAAVGTGP